MPPTLLKNAKLPAAYHGWQRCACNHSTSSPRKRLKFDGTSQSRIHTDVKSRGYEFRDNMNWPCRSIPYTPNPYDIFDLPMTGVYSKHKFYELVKIYHPDRSGHAGHASELSHLERLERYRLVVQAHEILSDPVKRKAFDASGAGWGARRASRHSRGYTNSAGTEYGYGPEHDSTIFKNATWEDWERWYRRNDKPEKQAYSGTFVDQNAFAAIVITLAVVSGLVQATRAGQFSGSLEEKAKAFTEETSRFLTTRANQFQDDPVTRDGRIKHFLEKRDPSKYGLKDEEEAVYRKHFKGDLQPRPRVE